MTIAIAYPESTAATCPDPVALPRLSRAHRRYYITQLLNENYAALIAHLTSTGTLLDYGCGAMPYRALLEPHLASYIGADLPGNADATATLDAAGRVDLPDASADFVLSSQVLEHVPDPVAYLAECRRLLRPGGKLFISTHGVWWHHPHPVDFWRWTGEGLRKILGEAGFTVTEFRGLMGLGATGAYLMQDGLYKKIPSLLRPPFYLTMQTLAAVLDRFTTDEQRQNNASVFLAVCQRK